MDITVTIPESQSIPAADVVAGAATRLGWTPDHPTTEAEYLSEWLADQVYVHYRSSRVDAAQRQVRDELPRPVRRQRVEPVEPAGPGGGPR